VQRAPVISKHTGTEEDPSYSEGDHRMQEIVHQFLNHVTAIEIPMTKTCNLRCQYCYIRDPHYKEIKISSQEIIRLYEPIRKTFPLMLKSGHPCSVIPWGAEPLCNWEAIEESLEYLFNKYQDVPIDTHWSTNATTTPEEYIEFIRRHQERITHIQISLDGPKEVHDFSRRTKDGQGSFLQVTSHLSILTKEIPAMSRKIMFKSTLSPQQVALGHFYLSSVFFWEELGLDQSPVSLTKDCHYDEEALQQLDEDLERCRQYCQKNPGKSLGWFNVIETTSNVCSAGTNAVSVDIDGEIYPCHAPATDDTKKQYFRIGNVFTGDIDYKGITRIWFQKYSYLDIHAALCKGSHCPLFPEYRGACWNCPIDMHNLNQIPFGGNISYCRVMQILFKHYKQWGKEAHAQSRKNHHECF